MAVWEYYIVAFSVKAARSNTYISFKEVKGGSPKCKYYIENHYLENYWTKYLYKK